VLDERLVSDNGCGEQEGRGEDRDTFGASQKLLQ